MQMLLLAVFMNRLWVRINDVLIGRAHLICLMYMRNVRAPQDFLVWVQYIGFAELCVLAFFTEIHISDVSVLNMQHLFINVRCCSCFT